MSSAFLPVPRDVSTIIVNKLEPIDILNTAKTSRGGLFSVTPIIKSYCKDPITIKEIETYIRDTLSENKEVIFCSLDGYGRYGGRSNFPDKSKENDPIISFVQIVIDKEGGIYKYYRETYALKTGIITRTNDEELEHLEPSIPIIGFIDQDIGIYNGRNSLNRLIEIPHNILLDKDTSINIYARRHICDREELKKLLIDKYTEFTKKGEDAEQEHPIVNFTLPGAIRRDIIRDDYLAVADTKQYGPLKYELCDLKEVRNILYMGLFRCDLESLRYQVYA